MLTWSPSLDREALVADGHQVVEYSSLCREVVTPAQRAAGRRESLANPAEAWLARLAEIEKLAVVGVQLRDIDDLVALHGYVLEPALRSGTPVAIESAQRLTRLPPEQFVDPEFEYPYTLERAIAAASSLYRGAPVRHAARRAAGGVRTRRRAGAGGPGARWGRPGDRTGRKREDGGADRACARTAAPRRTCGANPVHHLQP